MYYIRPTGCLIRCSTFRHGPSHLPLCIRSAAYLLHLEAEQLKDVTTRTEAASPDRKHARSDSQGALASGP